MTKKKRVLRFLKRYIVGLIFFTITILFLDFYIEKLTNEENKVKEIPNIDLLTHSNLNRTITINDLKGKIVLLDFWFANCKPCIKEMKYYSELLEQYKDKVTIISFSSDSFEFTQRILESKDKKWNFLDRNNPNWIFSNSNPENEKSLMNLLKIYQYPTYFLLDENGMVLSKPKSGVYAIEKQLKSIFSINRVLKMYLNPIEISKLYISIALYNIIVLLILIIQFLISFLKKRKFFKN